MNSKFLHILLVLASIAFLSLGALRAQGSPSADNGRDSTGTVAQNDGAAESQRSANAAIANDRDAVRLDAGSRFHSGWVGLLGLLGLLGLFRKERVPAVRRGDRSEAGTSIRAPHERTGAACPVSVP